MESAEKKLREVAALTLERDKKQAEANAIDQQIKALLGISTGQTRKPARKTFSDEQFRAACGVA